MVAAWMAGIMDAAIGGGGLISIPALFGTLPNELPAALMGTNKASACQGTLLATWRYRHQLRFNGWLLLPVAVSAGIGSYLGAGSLGALPIEWIRPLVMLLLALMLGYLLIRPSFGLQSRQRPLTQADVWRGIGIGAVLGFYDGFFGPGTGSFLIFLFVRVLQFDFLQASACAKVVNLATNLAALAYFMPQDAVLWHYALPMGLANIAGAWLGTRLALQGGNRWLRPMFLVMVLLLLGRLAYDSLSA